MENKICKKCNIEKSLEDFKKKSNLCLICFKEWQKNYNKKYKIENKDKIKLKDKEYYEENKDLIKIRHRKYQQENIESINLIKKEWYKNNPDKKKEYNKKWNEKNKGYKRNEANKDKDKLSKQKWRKNNPDYHKEYNKKYQEENKEKLNEKNKKYYENNKEKLNEKDRNRRKNDPVYKLSCNIRSMLYNIFIKQGSIKETKSQYIIGISFKELRQHIEKQFQPWMSWDNWGLYNGEFEYGWDIDHIEPLFPEGVKRTEEDIIRLNHYTNLQPLCSKINRDIKKNRLDF